MSGIQSFDYSINILQVLLWQNNKAPNISALLENKQAYIDESQKQFWSDWYTNVFDLRTCGEFGLQVWAIILGLPIGVKATPSTRVAWGFDQYHKNFDNGNFAQQEGGSKYLSTEDRRLLLRLRALQLFSNGSLQTINPYLTNIVGKTSYMIDNHDMTIDYFLGGVHSQRVMQAILDFDVLPRPAGVKIRAIYYGDAFFSWSEDTSTNSAGWGELDDTSAGGQWVNILEV